MFGLCNPKQQIAFRSQLILRHTTNLSVSIFPAELNKPGWFSEAMLEQSFSEIRKQSIHTHLCHAPFQTDDSGSYLKHPIYNLKLLQSREHQSLQTVAHSGLLWSAESEGPFIFPALSILRYFLSPADTSGDSCDFLFTSLFPFQIFFEFNFT